MGAFSELKLRVIYFFLKVYYLFNHLVKRDHAKMYKSGLKMYSSKQKKCTSLQDDSKFQSSPTYLISDALIITLIFVAIVAIFLVRQLWQIASCLVCRLKKEQELLSGNKLHVICCDCCTVYRGKPTSPFRCHWTYFHLNLHLTILVRFEIVGNVPDTEHRSPLLFYIN